VQRLERLINLVAALLETDRPLSAEEVRRRLPGYADDLTAFRRTFERDKEALRELGIPITAEPIEAANEGLLGYRVDKTQYYLADPGLEADELAALHLAASAVHLGGGDGLERVDPTAALWKLGGEVRGGEPIAAQASLPVPAGLTATFGAIASRSRVTFEYRGRRRRLDPYRLSFRYGRWYLLGWDHAKRDQRWYRVDRIGSAVQTDGESGVFDRPRFLAEPVAPWEMGEGEAVKVRLLVDADQSGLAIGQLGREAAVEHRPDGSVVFEVAVTNPHAFRSFVLGFGDFAEILEPPQFRLEMVAWLEAIATACPAPSSRLNATRGESQERSQ